MAVVSGAAHSCVARAGRLLPGVPVSRPGVLSARGQSAVAAAQRKHASSRAQATTVTLCGLPRERMR